MDAHCEAILDEYRERLPLFQNMRDALMGILQEQVIKKSGIYFVTTEARVKTEKSLSGKLELKGMKYRSLGDITDIIGARLVTFYSDEIDKVAALVEKLFNIDWENSIDKRKMYEQDRFGYMSLHYICRIPKEVYFDETRPEINEIPFELQIKTALQHVWATIHHDMGYKSDVDVPKEYSRSLFRLAGLLELADEEFKAFRQNIADYRRKVLALVKNGKFDDIDLNVDSFRNYLSVEPFRKLTEQIATTLHAEIMETSLMPYFKVLATLGVKTLGDIEKLKKECSEDALRLALYQMGDKDIDIVSSSVAIQNLCIVGVLKNGAGELGIRIIYDTLYGERDRNKTTAKRIMEQAKHLNIIEG